jgi:hypothetical protein
MTQDLVGVPRRRLGPVERLEEEEPALAEPLQQLLKAFA